MATIERVRQIVEQHQAAKIDGALVDAFTASAIITVYDALSATNQKRYAAMPIMRLADIAWTLLAKKEA